MTPPPPVATATTTSAASATASAAATTRSAAASAAASAATAASTADPWQTIAAGLDFDAYLSRIGYDGPLTPTTDVLRALAERHALAIPFENLAVLASGAPDLSLAAVQAKIVGHRRGGYCYEINGLLGAALTGLGFDVTRHSARVRFRVPPGTMTARSHMVLCVQTVEGRMLVDAGFGSHTLTVPVAIDRAEAQPTTHENVRVRPDGDGFLLQAQRSGDWCDLYRFDLWPQLPVDYEQQNWHTATRPGALFANNVVAARPVPGGRHALFNRTLAWRTPQGDERRRTVESRAMLEDALAGLFGIEPSPGELAAAWECSGRSATDAAAFI